MWMSHGDKLHAVPDGFKAVGTFLFVMRPIRPSCCFINYCVVCLVCLFSLVIS